MKKECEQSTLGMATVLTCNLRYSFIGRRTLTAHQPCNNFLFPQYSTLIALYYFKNISNSHILVVSLLVLKTKD